MQAVALTVKAAYVACSAVSEHYTDQLWLSFLYARPILKKPKVVTNYLLKGLGHNRAPHNIIDL